MTTIKMKAGEVFSAALVLSQIIREGRPLPTKGQYRLARMHSKLLPEFTTIANQRDALITAYDHKEPDATEFSVPTDKLPAFQEDWKKIAEEVIEFEAEPIPLGQLDLGDNVPGAITASELVTLGELVRDD